MLRLHYAPGSHGSPVCPKRNAPRGFGHFFSVFKFCYVLLSFLTVYHGVRDGPLGKGAAESRRLYGARHTTDQPAVYHGCQYIPSRPVTF